MKALASQTAKLLLALALCHVALLGLSLFLYPVPRIVDTAHFRDVPYPNPYRASVNAALENGFGDGPNLVVMGPSNAIGFRPRELMPLLPNVLVHNLATASMRIDEMRLLLQLVWDSTPPTQHRRTTFVVTLSFTSFPHADSAYGRREAGVAPEIARTGLFRSVQSDFAPRFGASGLRLATLIRRPLALGDTWSDSLSRRTFGAQKLVSGLLRGRAVELSTLTEMSPPDKWLFPSAATPAGRKANLAFLAAQLASKAKSLGEDQFAELQRICNWARAHSARLVLVGMPVPRWVRSEAPYFAEYERRLQPIVAGLGDQSSVRFVDLHRADLPLWDATHPEPARTGLWAAALVEALEATGLVPGDGGTESGRGSV